MGTRNRVRSFMLNFSNRESQTTPASPAVQSKVDSSRYDAPRQDPPARQPTTPLGTSHLQSNVGASESPPSRTQRERAPSRPMSMIQTYQPALMDVSQDTLPELQPIFTFLNSHSNKLYQEGYFLKLDDQNTNGRPNADRTWTECFAQLVGTILSLWDAAELDAAGQDGEVLPKFINLTDASIKMIDSLPTRSDHEAPLQNVLSISTAGKNRYLLHFNSHHSMVQWTAGIRLAMFEHATLQEAYTGALIAGKGRALNNINIIMERSKFKTEDWARVRFGAGTPWRRCWCVISPPDEKEVQKLQKQMNKKKSAYDRSRPPVLKGDIKFYDTKKTKKVQPIATISNAYSAFAIYPQSKPLIDASTLVKVEGSITIHSNPPSTTEGFVFVMPEVHPAVTGFEMMLRWLFPVFDTFAIYGRPGRLIADTTNPQSLMFAMPKHRRYGYLEIMDVSGLIVEQGSAGWKESEWRRRMKELTAKRMAAIESGSRTASRYSSRRSTRNSFGPSRTRVQFDDGASVRSTPSTTWNQGPPADVPYGDVSNGGIPRTDSAPPSAGAFPPPRQPLQSSLMHRRSVSETPGMDRFGSAPNYDGTMEQAPTPPPHHIGVTPGRDDSGLRYRNDVGVTAERFSSEDEQARATPVRELQELRATTSPEPVVTPPAFAHAPGSMPASKPYHSPELRRANSRMSNGTLSQLAGAAGVAAAAYHGDGFRTSEDQNIQNVGPHSEETGQRGVLSGTKANESHANYDGLNEGLVTATNPRFSFEQSSPIRPSNTETPTNLSHEQHYPFISPSTTNPRSDASSSMQHSDPIQDKASYSRMYDPPQVVTNPTSQSTRSQQAPIVHSHTSQPSTDSINSTSSQPPRLQTRESIIRKPLPVQSSSIQTPTSAETFSSTGSLGRLIMDQAAFDLIGTLDDSLPPKTTHLLGPQETAYRQNSLVSSVYDDGESEPDYASTTRPSFDTQKSVEKPRAGVMRTVGNGKLAAIGKDNEPSFIPNVDFGPTYNLTSERVRQQPSSTPMQSYGADSAPGRQSPGPVQSYSRPHSSGHSRSPSRPVITPEGAHYRTDSAESRTVAWQPGMSAVGGTLPAKQRAITPEQFVQQRAAAATPLYAHQRQASGNVLRSRPPTPPLVRNRSSELIGQQVHSRHTSADLLQRPSSRGASVALGPSGTGDIASSLSAREQEHLAKMTGQPLINMTQNNRQSTTGAGLVGAIQAREKDKQLMMQGIKSQAVQQVIAQRQQQTMYQQYPDQSADYPAAQSQYGNMGQYGQAQFPVQTQRQQSWVAPQGAGWSAPLPSNAMPPEQQGQQSPWLPQYPQQQQYFGHPQQQGGQGRGNSGYRG